MSNPVDDPGTELNWRLRAERAGTKPDGGEPGTAGYAASQLSAGEVPSHRRRLSDGWALDETPSIEDLPGIGWMSRVPVLGGMLAFGREVYGLLWVLANRRSPLGQQIRFNRAVADALSLLDIELQLDRELQALKRDVGILDARTVLETRMLESRLETLAEQVRLLAEQVREIRNAAERNSARAMD